MRCAENRSTWRSWELERKELTTGDKHIPLLPGLLPLPPPLAGGCAGELAARRIVATNWGRGGSEYPWAPSDLTGSKQHFTFPALKEYDSREADRENRESSKEREGEARDKSHTKCRLPPKQLVCNQRHSSLLSGQFDFHLSNEALIFGLITVLAKLKLAARQSIDNSQLRRRLCEQPLLLL